MATKRKKAKRDTSTWTPTRQLGRVSDEYWDFWKRAAAAAGKSFTDWAREALTRAANEQDRELAKRKGK